MRRRQSPRPRMRLTGATRADQALAEAVTARQGAGSRLRHRKLRRRRATAAGQLWVRPTLSKGLLTTSAKRLAQMLPLWRPQIRQPRTQ